ncbi:peptidylprolyl isomerase [Leptolyngbya sp. BC1307]|uniref:peptidylprolyl isomerase n=1 Tax=Leptolyngbya sp. BC1307 TaxID=2029589 RepID=UPI000EFB38CF|nr:peptidylprolyl isomerase [Leptolyngbya sp. BC1307]
MILGIHSRARWSVLVAIALLLGSCSGAEPPAAEAPAAPTAAMPAAPDAAELTAGLAKLTGKATVEIVVDGSPITIEVDGDLAPYTAGNFVDLAEKGVYDGTVFHRVVRSPEPFVVQGGDPQSTDPNVPVSQLGTGSYIDPATGQPRLIPLEILPEGADQPVYGQTFLEAGVDAEPALTHRRGAIAMARSGVNTASAQFYITLADVTFLDGDYAVFGYVTAGMDVVDEIEAGAVIESVTVTAGADNLVLPASGKAAAE